MIRTRPKLRDPAPDFFRRSRRARMPPPLEVRTHIALADLLDKACDKRRWIWTHLPFGGKRTEATGALLKRMGVKPGWPDFIFISWTGHFHFLELKRGARGELNEHQQSFFAAMRARNIECRVARSFNEAVRILGQWGVLAPAIVKQFIPIDEEEAAA